MAVTGDKYELPLFVTTRLYELAREFGVSQNNILSCIAHKTSGRFKGIKFVRVIIDDEENEDEDFR